MEKLTWNDFEKIVIDEMPLIDVRAPLEFNKGTFKNTVNLPLMNDEERHLVGICYKKKGSEEAVRLGHQLVCGEIKEARVNAWTDHLKRYPDSLVYCFRGGLRSQITQQWIKEITGKNRMRIEGGYKAFRQYLRMELEPSQLQSNIIMLGGCTGSGKTILLKKLENAIDLEGIANHRGSAFGSQVTPQATQINFENNLAYAMIKHKHKGYKDMVLEDEGAHVGKCFLPRPLFFHFKSSDLVILEASIEERVAITLKEYVVESQGSYKELFEEEQALIEWANHIRNGFQNIKKRLGGEFFKEISHLFEQAYWEQVHTGSYDLHKRWIEKLLVEYYDPMYQFQMQKVKDRIIYQGNKDEVLDYLKNKESY